MNLTHEAAATPGAHLDLARMPGHWLLARLGKRVLRPGGIELTRQMLDGLEIGRDDRVVELAPGMGATARLALAQEPASYVAVERDAAAVVGMRRMLRGTVHRCLEGTALATGLDAGSASVIYGEAMLTMQTANQKTAIVREAFRVLRPGGRYGIHELALTPEDLPEADKEEVARDLSRSIRVGARPLTLAEWRGLLASAGFEIAVEASAPMHLLEPSRIVADEGVLGTMRIAANIAVSPAARRRVLDMRGVFQRHMKRMCAVTIVARKPDVARR